jgi:hypothetical protein
MQIMSIAAVVSAAWLVLVGFEVLRAAGILF